MINGTILFAMDSSQKIGSIYLSIYLGIYLGDVSDPFRFLLPYDTLYIS